MQKVVTAIKFKTVDEAERIIEGWCSTGDLDRAGDRLVPEGCEYDLDSVPVPFLLDHNAEMAVGEIEAIEISPKGVRFRARIKKIANPGRAKELVDYAFDLLRNRLRNSLSVGFLPLEAEPLPGGGYLYRRWSLLEISAVAIPCNPRATVTSVKRHPAGGDSFSPHQPTCSGKLPVVRLSSPVKSAPAPVVKLTEEAKIIGRILHDSKRRSALMDKLGAPLPVVKLDAAHEVEQFLAKVRQARRASRGGKVRVR